MHPKQNRLLPKTIDKLIKTENRKKINKAKRNIKISLFFSRGNNE